MSDERTSDVGMGPPLAVLEIEGGTAVAYAARLLADLGATVTTLAIGTTSDGDRPALDAGKRITRQQTPDEPALAALLAGADLLLYDDAASGLPLSAVEARGRHPSLITATVTPCGESGPRAAWKGTDLTAFHAGGLGYGTPPRVTDPEAEHPLGIPGDPLSMLCGVALAGGVLHALLERDRDGRGRHVELSAQEVVASCMFNNVAGALGDGDAPSRLASARPFGRKPLIACNDGYVAVMANRPAHVRAWLGLFGADGEALIECLESGASSLVDLRAAVDTLAERWAVDKSKHEVARLGQERHVPVAPLLDPAELLASPQLAARGFWRTATDARGGDVTIPEHPFGPVAEGDPPRLLPARVEPPAEADGRGTAPLAGVRVVDFGWLFAGPIATRVLAALGATVLRIEHPDRLDMMRERPFAFRAVNADKESVAVDAKSPDGRRALLELLDGADVVAENFAPGAMARLGLEWETLHARNPQLIMLSVSGMGQTGPLAHWAMLGQLAQAYAGVTALVGYEGGPPRGIEDGGFWSDPATGYAATAALLSALRERAATGRGRRIDISLVEATAALFIEPLLAAQRGDVWRSRGNLHPAMAPHDLYRCDGDDRWLALAVRDDAEWRSLCAAIGRADLADDPSLATLAGRQAQRPRLRDAIESWTRRRTPEAAATALQAVGVPAAPSNDARDLLHDPHLRARGFFEDDPAAPGGVTMMAFPPWRLHPAGEIRWGPAPLVGQHAPVWA